MLPTISIVILVMAYVGILQHTGLMQSLIEPITSRLKLRVACWGNRRERRRIQRAASRSISGYRAFVQDVRRCVQGAQGARQVWSNIVV